jgi:hypothetical protein
LYFGLGPANDLIVLGLLSATPESRPEWLPRLRSTAGRLQFFETQFLLAYKKLFNLGVQRLGHLYLLEKTKVMGCICK